MGHQLFWNAVVCTSVSNKVAIKCINVTLVYSYY